MPGLPLVRVRRQRGDIDFAGSSVHSQYNQNIAKNARVGHVHANKVSVAI